MTTTIKIIAWAMLILALCNNASAQSFEKMDEKWEKISPAEIKDNAFELLKDDWMAVAAGNKDKMNAMTISWGGLGELWGRAVVTVYVSPSRYTFEFMENNEYFTVSAFPEEYRKALSYLGSHSGRDGDKIAAAGLHSLFTNLGNPAFDEARLVIECKKIYATSIDPDKCPEDVKKMYTVNKRMEPHHLYIGEIVNVWVKK